MCLLLREIHLSLTNACTPYVHSLAIFYNSSTLSYQFIIYKVLLLLISFDHHVILQNTKSGIINPIWQIRKVQHSVTDQY